MTTESRVLLKNQRARHAEPIGPTTEKPFLHPAPSQVDLISPGGHKKVPQIYLNQRDHRNVNE